MENGLSDDPSEPEQELFENLSHGDRDVLSNGFGPNVYACWNVWNVRVGSELSVRGGGDLQRGLALIRQEV